MTSTQRFLSRATAFGMIVSAISGGCASPQAEIDAQADPVFKRMCSLLDGAKAFRFRVNATIDREVDTGQLAQFHRASEIAVRRPNRLYATTDSDEGKWSAWYHDKSLTVLDRETNTYATEPVPGSIDKMLDYMADNYDLIIPSADLLVGKTYDSLLTDVDSGTYLGLHSVGDIKCHHVLFRQQNLDWQVWIDAGQHPLPRKLVITYTQERDQPQYVATMDNWDLHPSLSEEMFQFTPPSGANSVPMLDLISVE